MFNKFKVYLYAMVKREVARQVAPVRADVICASKQMIRSLFEDGTNTERSANRYSGGGMDWGTIEDMKTIRGVLIDETKQYLIDSLDEITKASASKCVSGEEFIDKVIERINSKQIK